MFVHPTKIRASFVATDCKWCFFLAKFIRQEYGAPLLAAQEMSLKDHVLKHDGMKEFLNESASQ